jgi:hypothetical protein
MCSVISASKARSTGRWVLLASEQLVDQFVACGHGSSFWMFGSFLPFDLLHKFRTPSFQEVFTKLPCPAPLRRPAPEPPNQGTGSGTGSLDSEFTVAFTLQKWLFQ